MLSSRKFLYSTTNCLHVYKYGKTTKRPELRLCQTGNARGIQTVEYSTTQKLERNDEDDLSTDHKVEALRDRLIFSDYLESKKLKLGYKKNKIVELIRQKKEIKKRHEELMTKPVISVALKYLIDENKTDPPKEAIVRSDGISPVEKLIQMPYASTRQFESVKINEKGHEPSFLDEKLPHLNEKYKILYEKYLENVKDTSSKGNEQYKIFKETTEPVTKAVTTVRLTDDLSKVPHDWMTDYEQYDDSLEEYNWQLNYGTPEPNSNVSSIPCGGCGALLHCKDTAIPGYLPSELFLKKKNDDLKAMICQRCHFMKNYNTSLGVNVSPDEYPKLLQVIKKKRAAVVLMVDLMDFPCSVWPDILNIIGHKRPVFVVGNKVDLLPQDSPQFLTHVKECLAKSLQETGIHKGNIQHIALISAYTGYGVEELINKLHNVWGYKGDVYLIGCTNVGKSTLYNALLQSDYCKVQAVDLIQRATTSPWPGTTLNLLKFPIMRPSGWRLFMRTKRLQSENREQVAEQRLRRMQLNRTRNLKHATLIGRIGKTFTNEQPVAETNDLFIMGSTYKKEKKLGLDESLPEYQNSRWCYDTPGTVQPDQVLHLLTTDELMLTLPKQIIIPRTFIIQPGHSLFLAGLGRLDYLEGRSHIRYTVFACDELPITICHNNDATDIYKELLQTEAFVVPFNDPERLKQWPDLVPKNFEITGIDWDKSTADVVLSSAGWIAVTPGQDRQITLRAWTPEGRGIYLRYPALLENTVALRGPKIRDSVAYNRGMPVYRKP